MSLDVSKCGRTQNHPLKTIIICDKRGEAILSNALVDCNSISIQLKPCLTLHISQTREIFKIGF